jgi:hypothetical protein
MMAKLTYHYDWEEDALYGELKNGTTEYGFKLIHYSQNYKDYTINYISSIFNFPGLPAPDDFDEKGELKP